MWRIKQFMPKEKSGLEGRMIDVGNLKIHVRNVIAEGGFSCVYLAQDALNGSKQYALKHMICNDEESLELARKEIRVMKSLQGHPNVVTLCAHTILDMGRTKEALLVMEYCDKSMVSVLESRGAGFFEEKQILLMFRDICNAVFAMHCQSPPIAHRDLKAENLLLGSDGLWKLCDFGSTSTNHKRFERPEEMGIEEDTIRKHTTPAYRSPEMWDLLLREVISEKVDIWVCRLGPALGCLLFRICYFKSAFDGESKLQVLNGNYRIPESPKYGPSITNLIRDMLQSSPDSRPDITQARDLLDWTFISINLVNGLLPEGLQKSLPDRPPEMLQADMNEGEVLKPHLISYKIQIFRELSAEYNGSYKSVPKSANKSSPMPRRSPPPPPTAAESARNSPQPAGTGGSGGSMGAFWTTQHAKDLSVSEELSKVKFDEEPTGSERSRSERFSLHRTSPPKEETPQSRPPQKSVQGKSGASKDFELNFFQDGPNANSADAFNAFATEFGSNKVSPRRSNVNPRKEDQLEAEVERLREQLTQVNMEKSELSSKYEKLSAICRLQRQELHELKQTLASRTPSPNKSASKSPSPAFQNQSPSQQQKDGTFGEIQKGFFDSSPTSSDQNSWQAFPEDSTTPTLTTNSSKSVRTRNGHQNKQAAEAASGASTNWGFEADSFTAVPTVSSQVKAPVTNLNHSQRFGDSKTKESSTGRGQLGNRVTSDALANESAETSSFSPLIGRKVRARWPEDNNFYEATIADYNEGRHALVYDRYTENETWEWVNLAEMSPEDIQWVEGEDPGIPHIGGFGGSGHGMGRPAGRDIGPCGGMTKCSKLYSRWIGSWNDCVATMLYTLNYFSFCSCLFNKPQQKDRTFGDELQKGLFDDSPPSSDQASWQAFPADSTAPTLTINSSKSVSTRIGHQNKQTAEVSTGANGGYG
ncbi:Protein kinase, catalytic domain-containing protein [Artemisia annua]|uniref:non-specific serine/threonine protein kinase n=1 Tax=Artemisia annua TaxID=35608 RepID=A0A2U1MU07_ARTAN|nr:Protein kinase, catalytic domain-containing protein [Artemisia annua]